MTTNSSRRRFLQTGAVAGAGLLFPLQFGGEGLISSAKAGRLVSKRADELPPVKNDMGVDLLNPDSLVKYVDEMPAQIPVAKPRFGISPAAAFYRISMEAGKWRFHRDMPGETPTFCYSGSIPYLGPTIEARKHEQVVVQWVNNLPAKHILQIDPKILMGVPPGTPECRAVVHLHGAHVPSQWDGGPEDWFVPGTSRTYWYPNIQDAAPLWYHDHAIGITRLNVYAGLAGLYFIRDSVEQSLNLPKGLYEIPLILQDKSFNPDGTLYYYYPWMPEFFGNVMVVNGKAWPKLQVERRKYRFRIYNGANARFFNIYGEPGLEFNVIGTEGGLLPTTVKTSKLLIGNGERYDVIVDFSKFADGTDIILRNDAGTPYDPTADPLTESTDPQDMGMTYVMKFEVRGPAVSDTSKLPLSPRRMNKLTVTPSTLERQITVVEAEDQNPMGMGMGMRILINNEPFLDPVTMKPNISEKPKLGATEIWNFINLTPDTHPMHMHLVQFQVIGRQKLAMVLDAVTQEMVPKYLGANGGAPISHTGPIPAEYLDGPVMPPSPDEAAWKDTAKAHPNEVLKVVAKFEHFTGKFVYHCHILDHEENDMMHYMQVVPGLRKEGEEDLPSEFALEQNYPNPFNPATNIQFTVPQQERVSVKVFNAVGQEVATLADEVLSAGRHTLSWDGSGHASGMYFCRMRAGSFVSTIRMLMVK